MTDEDKLGTMWGDLDETKFKQQLVAIGFIMPMEVWRITDVPTHDNVHPLDAAMCENCEKSLDDCDCFCPDCGELWDDCPRCSDCEQHECEC